MNPYDPLLIINRLHHEIESRALLSISALAVNRGDCIVLSGDNGSGKTTLMKALAGLDRCQQMEIQVGQQTLTGRSAARWLGKQAVYLHQQAYMFDRSVRDNISYGLKHGKGDSDSLEQAVTRALEWSDLTALADRHARHLSGGEKQRVALTRARIVAPVLLLLDEPTGGLDRRSRERTYTMINRLSEEGMTIIVSTHDDPEHYSFANRSWHISGQSVQTDA